jgi:putative oxidoreductase
MPGASSIRSNWGPSLQRLFSTFPDGWPGAALVLLRLCLGIPSILFGIADFPTWHAFAGIGGMFLIAGMWTPATGILIAIVESWIAWSLYRSRLPAAEMHLFLAALSVSVTMLGPGAWSVDARLFGRKRFDVDGTRGRKVLSRACGGPQRES